MPEKIIGGEMEFDLCAATRPEVNGLGDYGSCHASGRAALYSILQSLKSAPVRRVLLPDYLCSSVVTTVAAAGMDYAFYSLDDSLRPDLTDIGSKIDGSSAVLTINYFGMQDLAPSVAALKKLAPETPVIADDVQALYSFLDPTADAADYSFTSLRKWLPVPDGALVSSRRGDIPAPENVNGFWMKKLRGLALKGMRDELGGRDDIYLRLLEEGEDLIDGSLAARGSDVAAMVFERTDLEADASKRRRNAAVILEGLREIGIKPILEPREGDVAFFIPVLLDDRDAVRRKLFSHNIFCPVHWPLDGLRLERGAFMAAHELSIIIDQRYSPDDMMRILSVLHQNARTI